MIHEHVFVALEIERDRLATAPPPAQHTPNDDAVSVSGVQAE